MKTASVLFILLLLTIPFALSQDDSGFEDPELFGLEVEKLLAFFGGILAAALATFTYIAYKRTKRSKLAWVGLAFVLFALKLFLISTELVIDEIPWVDIASAILDFAILLSFFFGVIKK